MLVGDIVGDTSLTTRLSPGASGLQVEFLAPLLEAGQTFLGPSRQINVDRGSHASAQVGGARMEISILGVQHKVLSRLSLDRVLHGLDSSGQAVENTTDITTLIK